MKMQATILSQYVQRLLLLFQALCWDNSL